MVAAWSVDRLGRSLEDLVGFLAELQASRCELYLHQQGPRHFDTSWSGLVRHALGLRRLRTGDDRGKDQGGHREGTGRRGRSLDGKACLGRERRCASFHGGWHEDLQGREDLRVRGGDGTEDQADADGRERNYGDVSHSHFEAVKAGCSRRCDAPPQPAFRPPEAGDTGSYAEVSTGLVTACLPVSRLRSVKAGCGRVSRNLCSQPWPPETEYIWQLLLP